MLYWIRCPWQPTLQQPYSPNALCGKFVHHYVHWGSLLSRIENKIPHSMQIPLENVRRATSTEGGNIDVVYKAKGPAHIETLKHQHIYGFPYPATALAKTDTITILSRNSPVEPSTMQTRKIMSTRCTSSNPRHRSESLYKISSTTWHQTLVCTELKSGINMLKSATPYTVATYTRGITNVPQ